jgi:hypothetical protein
VKTYQYTSPENTVVAVIDEDGKSRMSMLASEVPEGEPILPYVAPPTPVPEAVTMRQARLALLGAGLLSQVDAAIASLPSPQKEAAAIEWEYAQEVQRHNGLVPAMAQALGMTEAQLDDLFMQAATL